MASRLSPLRSFALAALATALPLTYGCAEADGDHHDDGDESLGTTSSALSAADPVSTAVSQSCSTTAVKALATQLVGEIQCMKPGSMKRIDNIGGLALGAAVFPYLQTSAANALVNAQKARGVTMSINSGLRTLPQQYLLYRWYQTGRCGIGLAATPGTSNHESGIAVDINDNAGWKSSMSSKGFHWLGASDPVHFDFSGGGTIDMKGLSVLAFQRLWNRNNPNDKIDEDGSYGPSTESRLAKSPVGGFPIGPLCASSQMPSAANGGDDASGDPASSDPNAKGAVNDDAPPATAGSSEATTASATLDNDAPKDGTEQGGCSAGRSVSSPPSSHAAAAGGLALMALVITRRRRRSA